MRNFIYFMIFLEAIPRGIPRTLVFPGLFWTYYGLITTTAQELAAVSIVRE